MDCSICLEEIKQDQPTSQIDTCEHTFHKSCLEPWFLRHSTCPNCRGPIQNQQEILSQERQRGLLELDRLYLTYTVFSWILQTFNGIKFHRYSNSIHSFLADMHWNGVRPISFFMTSRNKYSLSSIKALRGYCMSREQTLFQELYPGDAHRVIHRNPRTVQIRNEIQQQLVTFVQTLL
jgi:hypothetical protein